MTADDQKDSAAGDAAATIVDDQGVDVLASAKVRAAASKVALDGAHGLAAARHDSFAPTFAKHADQTEFSIEVAGAQAAEFRDAQPRAVEELEDGAVAKTERRVVRVLD